MIFETITVTLKDGRRLTVDADVDTSRPPLVYLHGQPGSRLQRHPDPQIIRDCGFRLITMDRPGMGGSDFQPGRRLLDWPDDVAQVADALGLGKFHLLGVSGGGPYAAACALRLADRLHRVALVSSLAPFTCPAATRGMMAPLRLLFRVARLAPWLLAQPAWVVKLLARNRQERGAGIVRRFVPPCDVEILFRPPVRRVLTADFAAAMQQGVRGVVREVVIDVCPWGFDPAAIRAPVDLWHGELDRVVPVTMGRYLAACIPGCRATYLPDAGHYFLFDYLPPVLAALREGVA